MCVIVHQPAGSYLSKTTAKEMWERNPDGGGFAYINEQGRIVEGKAMSFNKFWSMFETERSANRDKDFLVHMRIATSGKIGIENTHPFRVDEHTIMAHNGMLNHIVGSISKDAELSDTREFIKTILPRLPEDWLDNPVIVDMVEDYIGGSKLMFLTTNPKLQKQVYILNKDMGTEKHHMWWSNTSHERSTSGRKSWEARTVESREVKDIGNNTEEVTVHYQDGGTTSYTRKKMGKKPDDFRASLPFGNGPSEDAKVHDPTEDEVKAFWEHHANGVVPEDQLSTSELRSKEARMALRQDAGLGDIDIYLNPENELWTCTACHEIVSIFSGDCKCWDYLCVGCGAVGPYCVHDSEDREWVLVKDAPTYYSEKQERERKEKETEQIAP